MRVRMEKEGGERRGIFERGRGERRVRLEREWRSEEQC